MTEIWSGLVAVPRGAALLASDPRSLLWLAPPIGLTLLAFFLAASWFLGLIEGALKHQVDGPGSTIDGDLPEWMATAVEWLLQSGATLFAAEAAAWLLTLMVTILTFWFAFSIVFEGIAGPFLDEIHGRFEERFFGADPRARLERPEDADNGVNLRCSIAAGIGSVLAVPPVWSLLDGGLALAGAAAAALAPWLVAGVVVPRFGRWLAWIARIEGRALNASLLSLAVTGFGLVAALPLLLIPVLGAYLYGAAAGFATSLALLDLPFSRRGLDLGARVRFVRQHPLAAAAFGAVAGALFGIPFVGPLVVVPSASVGGLWLFCRLDKRRLAGGGRQRPEPRA